MQRRDGGRCGHFRRGKNVGGCDGRSRGRREWGGRTILGFNEKHITRNQNMVGGAVIASICFRVIGVPDEGTFSGAIVQLWIICWDMHESLAANLAEVGDVGRCSMP